MNFDKLKLQNAETSNAVIKELAGNDSFIELSKREAAGIIQRDEEDGKKLQVGIELAIEKGVIPGDIDVEPTTKIDVCGKSPDEVVEIMMEKMGSAASKGCVMTLQGYSGTGKGTTVAALLRRLPNASAWSNGNIFRSLTLLATTYAEKNDCELKEALTPKKLEYFCDMLTFDKFGDKFDVKIEGMGMSVMVSEVQNTLLKSSSVSSQIPTVAEVTQGEVITFVQAALKKMVNSGMSVLLEGREQTLNYIRTPFRFELVLGDTSIIGQRRAAQKIAAAALANVQQDANPDRIGTELLAALDKMCKL